MGEIKMLTYEEQEAMRKVAMDEVGTEPKCPFCGRPRVSRSSYIRCNPCGVNWANEEMHLPHYLEMDPRVARTRSVHTANATRPTADMSKVAAEERR